MVTIEIDGRTIEAEKGQMLIDAADKAGIYIPRFCYHKHLSVAANCRMCLVEVEKAPKPMPACATPVADGMKVFTKSEKAVSAQKGTMEFLLINHPLDCPICDQGGECELQDLAVGYGGDQSRYHESKRVVPDPDLGPLIATEMTRCIHCTRCVRFGDEIAGIQELGATGRGEHMKIGTYVQKTVDSELSGNVIDLCPVGALTSKPFKFEARSWEMVHTDSVAPHDCAGSPIQLQTLRGALKRVLPMENPDINECWLSDRDRFSYEAVIGGDRLQSPRIKQDGQWRETDWRTALEFVAQRLGAIREEHGGASLAGMANPGCTMEELYLFQKLMRGLDSDNVDCRLKLADSSDDGRWLSAPWLGMPISGVETMDIVVLVGTNFRKEQPIINQRLRKAVLDGAKVSAINPVDFNFNYPLSQKLIASPSANLRSLANIIQRLASEKGVEIPEGVASWTRDSANADAEKAIAKQLAEADASKLIVLGQLHWMHTRGAVLRALANVLATLSGATLAFLPEANAVGGWTAGCVPFTGKQQGKPASSMLDGTMKGFLLLGTEPELDGVDSGAILNGLNGAELVISITEYATANEDYAHVQLPRAAFTETTGTYINCEGKTQLANAAGKISGEARAGWKILRALAEKMGLEGFTYNSVREISADLPEVKLNSPCYAPGEIPAPQDSGNGSIDLECISDSMIYSVDPTVRRSEPLQRTADNLGPNPRVNTVQLEALGIQDGDTVRIHAGETNVSLPLVMDNRIPIGCVYLPVGYAETAALPRTATLRLVRG